MTATGAPIRLLVVDDDPDLVVQVRLLLRAARTPYLVEGHDIDQPLEDRLRTGDIDACLLDHFLWDRQGADVLRGLPRVSDLPPVVVLTGADDPALADLYLELGAADFLAKDEINPGMLDRSIRYAIQHSVARRHIARSTHALQRSERLATIGRLAEGVAHEYNNLNAVILSALEGLAAGDARVAERLEPVLASLERSRRISHGLLQLGRPTPSAAGPTDLHLQAAVTIGLLEGEARRAGVTLAADLGTSTLQARIDANDIHQVLANLVINGLHAVWRHPHPQVRVALGQDGAQAVLEVVDNGIGISDADLPRVCEPFFTCKGMTSASREYPVGIEGSGLGLAICATLVEQAGGTIAIASAVDAGTTVTVRLPLDAGAERGAPGAGTAPRLAPGSRIAVVDDNQVLLDLVGESLAGLGHTVSTFVDPAVFLQAALTARWDVLVLDWQMPRYTGRDVLLLLADPARRPPLPVLLVSGTTPEPPGLIPGIAVLGVLAKPFRMRSLTDALGIVDPS